MLTDIEKSPEIDGRKVTSKFSEFLRTFQHHRSGLSLYCIDEVRLTLNKFTQHPNHK